MKSTLSYRWATMGESEWARGQPCCSLSCSLHATETQKVRLRVVMATFFFKGHKVGWVWKQG